MNTQPHPDPAFSTLPAIPRALVEGLRARFPRKDLEVVGVEGLPRLNFEAGKQAMIEWLAQTSLAQARGEEI